jgi:hypothetical protein
MIHPNILDKFIAKQKIINKIQNYYANVNKNKKNENEYRRYYINGDKDDNYIDANNEDDDVEFRKLGNRS